MSEHPILFTAPMVRAILAGTKTMTRRVVKPQPFRRPCPYGKVGDNLWVRETWIAGWPYEAGELMQYDEDGNELPKKVWYRADGDLEHWIDDDECRCENIPWRPSIHMPRWASRITLTITDVRVERVQDITEEDARAEGVKATHPLAPGATPTYIPEFEWLWDSINARRGFGWDVNPWVWVIEFVQVTT